MLRREYDNTFPLAVQRVRILGNALGTSAVGALIVPGERNITCGGTNKLRVSWKGTIDYESYNSEALDLYGQGTRTRTGRESGNGLCRTEKRDHPARSYGKTVRHISGGDSTVAAIAECAEPSARKGNPVMKGSIYSYQLPSEESAQFRSPFRREGDHRSALKPITIPE
jgi:hypothetical protein